MLSADISAARASRASIEADKSAIEQARSALAGELEDAKKTLAGTARQLHGYATAVALAELAARAKHALVHLHRFTDLAGQIKLTSSAWLPPMPGVMSPGTPLGDGPEVQEVVNALARLGEVDLAPPAAAALGAREVARWRDYHRRLLLDADAALDPAPEATAAT